MHLCLQGSQLVSGEKFEYHNLFDLLYRPLPGQADDARARQPVLLYPDAAVPPAFPDQEERALIPEDVRLIILDGTWRKSRKMLHVNPLLQALPRLSLSPASASRYLIRRAPGPNQLSTLEAACHALSMLENREDKYCPLLQAFESFISLQAQWFRPQFG